MSQFLPSVPQPFDIVRDSQDDFQNNFEVANRDFGINHYAFDDANAGKHKHSVYTQSDSLPPVSDNEIVLFEQEVLEPRNNFYTRYNTGETFPFTPFMQCHINLVSTPDVGFTEIGASVNFDLEKSAWSRRIATIYFMFPYSNNNYYVEVTRSGVYTGSITLQVKNKTTEYFEIENPNVFVNNNAMQIRVM